MKNTILVLLISTLAGCAGNAVKQNWVVVRDTDQFTDKTTCTVTTGSFYSSDNIYTLNNHFYPFVQKAGSVILVGVQSGGKFKIPVGTIQLRIDSKSAWTITSAETPILASSANMNSQPIVYPANVTDEQKKLIDATYKNSMDNATKTMSPFTATTDAKANQILKEMLQGHKLIYRIVGLNQAASTTGEVQLDASLKVALNQCGITL